MRGRVKDEGSTLSAGPTGRRAYSSDVRAEGARRTRALIVAAATDRFVDRGFDATSIAEIAAAAGVARATVLAVFGSKTALLKTVLDEALAGDDDPVPVRDRPWFAPVWRATTAREVMTAYADVCLLISSRAAHVVEALRRASDSAPEIDELWHGWLRGRRAGADMVVQRQVVLDALRPDLTPRTAGDVLWTLNDPDLYVNLVRLQGWPAEQFRRWLAGTMTQLLLDPAKAGLPGPPDAPDPAPRPPVQGVNAEARTSSPRRKSASGTRTARRDRPST